MVVIEVKTIFIATLVVSGVLIAGYLIAFLGIETPSMFGRKDDAIKAVKDRVEVDINGAKYSNITAERIHLSNYNSFRVKGSVIGFQPSRNIEASFNFSGDAYFVNDSYEIRNFRLTLN